MFFVSNLLSSSQAGRRGFEPRLPLHLFNNLKTGSLRKHLHHTAGSRTATEQRLAAIPMRRLFSIPLDVQGAVRRSTRNSNMQFSGI